MRFLKSLSVVLMSLAAGLASVSRAGTIGIFDEHGDVGVMPRASASSTA